MTYIDADHCAPVTFAPDEVEELHALLGQLEDWLRHASDEVIEQLGAFVNPLYPRGAVLHVIDTLGTYCGELRSRGEGPQR